MKNLVLVLSVLGLGVGSVLMIGGNTYGVIGLTIGMIGSYYLDKIAPAKQD
jgi:hypothetical protein